MRMCEPRAHELVALARHDLRAAELLRSERQSGNIIAFLAQQTTEKAVKAVLAFHDTDYPRTHDIQSLLALARRVQPDAAQFTDDAGELLEYAVSVRYDLELFPSEDEVDRALVIARKALLWAQDIVGEPEGGDLADGSQ